MEFKPWYYLQEVIDTKDDEVIQATLAKKKYDPETIKKINVYLDKYRNDPNKFLIKDIMPTVIKDFPPVDDKAQKLDRMVKDYQRRPEVTPQEVETLKYFFSQDVSSEFLKEMMNLLREFLSRKLIELEIVNGKPELFKQDARGQKEKTNTPNFTQFISVLHGIQGSLAELGSADKYYDPRREYDPPNLVAEGDNIWVFKGSMPELCRKFGKNTKWCIASSSSTTNYYNYRLNHGQTQYFIFDFNKAENDPARYVNPGVAPPGKYSEWVDFRNQHSEDPEEPTSDFGINGYTSINDYKRYLASKGVDLSVFVADPIQDWEKRLRIYVNYKDFDGAKNDVESLKLWPSFLKLVKRITDDEFNTLTDAEKKMYVLKKWLTEHQREWAMTNYRKEYLSSIDDLEPIDEETANFVLKIKKTLSSEDVKGILKHLPDLSGIEERIGPKNLKKINLLNDDDIYYLMSDAREKEGVISVILNHKDELTDVDVYAILMFSRDIKAIEGEIGKENLTKINRLSQDEINRLLRDAKDRERVIHVIFNYKELTLSLIFSILTSSHDVNAIEKEIKERIGEENLKKINKLSDDEIFNLIFRAKDKRGIIHIILNHKELTPRNVLNILVFSRDTKAIEEKIGEENLTKINRLDDGDIFDLLKNVEDKERTLHIILNHKEEITPSNVYAILKFSQDIKAIGEENIKKINLLNDDQIFDLLDYLRNAEGVINLILNHKKELTPSNVYAILKYSHDIKAIEQKLGKENLNKVNQLDYDEIYSLLDDAQDQEGVIHILVNYKEELTVYNVLYILKSSKDVKAIEEKLGEENLKKVNELEDEEISYFMNYAEDREGLSYIIDKYRQK